MHINIYFRNQALSSIPYPSLPAFRLYCEEIGLQTQWDDRASAVHLTPALEGKRIFFVQRMPDEEYPSDLFSELKLFLSDSGAELIKLQGKPNPPYAGDLYLQLDLAVGAFEKHHLILRHHPEDDLLFHCLTNGLHHSGIDCETQDDLESVLPKHFIRLECKFPKQGEHQEFSFMDKMGVALAKGILEYFQKTLKVSPLSFFPHSALNPFNTETSKRVQTEKKQAEQFEQPQNKPSVQLLQAESFFDYTVHATVKEDRPFMVIGKLIVKNTGNEVLSNPVLCLRATPAAGMKLQGQMVPPNMVERMGVQSAGGSKGWKYLEEDWLEKGLEKGEFWISPIETMQIPPQGSESLHFQLTIFRQEPSQTVKLEAFVYFQEHNLRFPAQNRIAFSF
ncbi:hypothetical protein [Ammoniphilus sp. YIM 78166]|uniref:hypothetical protein n=1 Tax=Ammoniphilus sp. YIM 78166 TaxID=1644106 RepID=UPI00106FDF40|nr:hypothetical protein [Ammoniphilus sp. YIM 78166]